MKSKILATEERLRRGASPGEVACRGWKQIHTGDVEPETKIFWVAGAGPRAKNLQMVEPKPGSEI